MRTTALACALMLAATPAWARQSAGVKRTIPASAAHVTPPAAKAEPEAAKDAHKDAPKEAAKEAPKEAVEKKATDKPISEKPSAAKNAVSAESAAERIMRRLDEAFPKKPADAKTVEPPPSAKTTSNRTGATVTHRSVPAPGTAPREKASNRMTLTWRIALQWPEAIAPARQVK